MSVEISHQALAALARGNDRPFISEMRRAATQAALDAVSGDLTTAQGDITTTNTSLTVLAARVTALEAARATAVVIGQTQDTRPV